MFRINNLLKRKEWVKYIYIYIYILKVLKNSNKILLKKKNKYNN